MGPTILLDKSALQSLSGDEIHFLSKHYYLVVTPVLIMEILADLKKPANQHTLNIEEVKHLAEKLQVIDSCINIHYRDLCISSLSGIDVPMVRKPLKSIEYGVNITGADGRRGIYLPETIDRKALRDWAEGNFSDNDELFAEEWRKITTQIDLEGLRQRFAKWLKNLPKIENPRELRLRLHELLVEDIKRVQISSLSNLMNVLRVPEKIKTDIFNRWLSSNLQTFEDFAPYAFYCYEAELFFYFAVVLGFFSSRTSNRIDLEYLLYLPFCMVFSSNDNFHKEIIRFLLNENQDFIDGRVLKADLNWLHNEWISLTESEKRERAAEYGNYPPEKEESIAYQMWQKYMQPWKPGAGNRALKMTKEEEEELMKKLQPIISAINEYEGRS